MAETNILSGMGRRLYRQRKKMKLTQEETAELLEISTTFYGEVERGKRRLSIEKILLAYERLYLDPTYLLTGEIVSTSALADIFRDCPKDKQPVLEQILRDLTKLCQ